MGELTGGEQGLQFSLTPDSEGDPVPEALSGVVKIGDAAFEIAAAS